MTEKSANKEVRTGGRIRRDFYAGCHVSLQLFEDVTNERTEKPLDTGVLGAVLNLVLLMQTQALRPERRFQSCHNYEQRRTVEVLS
jgi:hypothetical protein